MSSSLAVTSAMAFAVATQGGTGYGKGKAIDATLAMAIR